ncbi:hypothetical protein MHUMG1_02073 [Metarhizium humberi]|uniref:Uncharacterized protein n=1 Tax=Metarhizium humberi TaxID=2596975 RepID=A0A9P8MIS8_9HYPO|nr:hypothetical protein MHUMG1_02073 [Metarhizium humberi]
MTVAATVNTTTMYIDPGNSFGRYKTLSCPSTKESPNWSNIANGAAAKRRARLSARCRVFLRAPYRQDMRRCLFAPSGGGSSGQAAKWVPPSRGVGSWTTWRSWLSRRKAENPPIFISTNAQHQLVQGKGKDEHPCPRHAWSGFSAAEASNSTMYIVLYMHTRHDDDDTAMGGLRVVGLETRNRLARTPGSFLSSSNHQGLWAMQADDWDTKLLSPLRSKILSLSAPSGRRCDMGQAVW